MTGCLNEDVFPMGKLENGDFPACHVGFGGVNVLIVQLLSLITVYGQFRDLLIPIYVGSEMAFRELSCIARQVFRFPSRWWT